MKKALKYIVSQIVDEVEKVEINEQEENGMINFTITVAPSDMGKIIGKSGKTGGNSNHVNCQMYQHHRDDQRYINTNKHNFETSDSIKILQNLQTIKCTK